MLRSRQSCPEALKCSQSCVTPGVPTGSRLCWIGKVFFGSAYPEKEEVLDLKSQLSGDKIEDKEMFFILVRENKKNLKDHTIMCLQVNFSIVS